MSYQVQDRIENGFEFSIIRSNLKPDSDILVTAIVSTYNSQKFFRGCILDLLGQTLYQSGALEILVIDSNSQQGEGEMLLEFEREHKNITYLRTKERESLYKAWNRAIKASAGRYITNANTDDRHLSAALELLSKALEDSDEAVLAYGDLIVTDRENETFECCSVSKYIIYPDFDPIYQIHFSQCGPQPMWRKSLHDRYGWFADGFGIAADYEWWLRIARYEKFIHVPQVIGLYLDSPGSIEHREPLKCQAETDLIRNFYAKAVSLDLDYRKYPINIFKDFYPCYPQADDDIKFSFICASADMQVVKQQVSELYKSALQPAMEIIVIHDSNLDCMHEFHKYSDKLRIRAVKVPENLNYNVKQVLGALHASSRYIAFAELCNELDEHKAGRLIERFEKENYQVIVVDHASAAITGISRVVFQASVFDALRNCNDMNLVSDFARSLSGSLN